MFDIVTTNIFGRLILLKPKKKENSGYKATSTLLELCIFTITISRNEALYLTAAEPLWVASLLLTTKEFPRSSWCSFNQP